MTNIQILTHMLQSNTFYHNVYEFQRYMQYNIIIDDLFQDYWYHYSNMAKRMFKHFKKVSTLEEVKDILSAFPLQQGYDYKLLWDTIYNKSNEILEYVLPFANQYDILSSDCITKLINFGDIEKLHTVCEYIKILRGTYYFHRHISNSKFDDCMDSKTPSYPLEVAIKTNNWEMVRYIISQCPLLDPTIITNLYNRCSGKFFDYIIATNTSYSLDMRALLDETSMVSERRMRLILYKQEMRYLKKIVKEARVKEFLLQKVVWGKNSPYIKRIYETYNEA